MSDHGLTHIALPVSDLRRSVAFYVTYAGLQVVHNRSGKFGGVAWVSDGIRPFVIVLIETPKATQPQSVLAPIAHIGIAVESRAQLDVLAERARAEGILVAGPKDSGEPVGYWCFIRDPDGHTLELSHGQDVAGSCGTR